MSAVTGKNLIYLYRLESEKATADGTRIALTTEDELSISADADATATKDGSVRGASVAELEKTIKILNDYHDVMSIMTQHDIKGSFLKKLRCRRWLSVRKCSRKRSRASLRRISPMQRRWRRRRKNSRRRHRLLRRP